MPVAPLIGVILMAAVAGQPATASFPDTAAPAPAILPFPQKQAASEQPAATASVAATSRGQSPLTLGTGSHTGHSERAKPGGLSAMVSVGSSLAIVLGLFFLVAWGLRRNAPRGSTLLPAEVFEVLGRAPLAGRQQVHLLRCGAKLLLVSITPAGTETLTEVTDPAEADRMAALCRQTRPQGPTTAFRQIFQQFAPRSRSRAAPDHPELAANPAARRGTQRWEENNA